LLVVAACGRIGFELPSDLAGDGGGPGDDGGAIAKIACADVNLGSALGSSVAIGSTTGSGNDSRSCGGDGNDVSFGWFAPASGQYVIDLCDSEQTWDSVLTIRDGSCTGPQLACGDDECSGLSAQPRVTLNLMAGQGIVIVVDSAFQGLDGLYQLAITKM
jgi:hypothetical protein